MRGVLVSLSFLILATSSAVGESWYEGERGRKRVLHLTLSAGLGAGFVLSESIAKPALAADDCRWCDPPAIDVAVRDALVWDDYDDARSFSNLTGYIAAPVFLVGVTALSSLQANDRGWGRLIDDTLPVLETVAISQAITQVFKFAVARQRPFVHYRNPAPDTDDNMSFYSGHSALTFGLTTSAGLIAHWRKSKLEPLIWGVGGSLSIATAYLRIAADKHYFTDVLTGTAVGIVAGLTIPHLMRHTEVAVIPTGNGLAVAGAF